MPSNWRRPQLVLSRRGGALPLCVNPKTLHLGPAFGQQGFSRLCCRVVMDEDPSRRSMTEYRRVYLEAIETCIVVICLCRSCE